MRKLPQFKDYTVDEKLREFRKVKHGENPGICFVPFDSERGRKLLKEMEARVKQ